MSTVKIPAFVANPIWDKRLDFVKRYFERESSERRARYGRSGRRCFGSATLDIAPTKQSRIKTGLRGLSGYPQHCDHAYGCSEIVTDPQGTSGILPGHKK